MTAHDAIIFGGLALNFITTIGAGMFVIGKFAAEMAEVKAAIHNDGKRGFVREGELDLLVSKADSEHRVFASEITTLRERTHGHEKVLGEHEARIAVLEEGGA